MTDRTRKYQPTDADAAAEKVDTRRIAPGVRRSSDFFDEAHQRREMTRGEYLNVRGSEEWSRRESKWWRKLLRFIRGEPIVVDFNARLAQAHGRTIEEVKAKLLQQAAEMQDALAKRKAAHVDATIAESRDA